MKRRERPRPRRRLPDELNPPIKGRPIEPRVCKSCGEEIPPRILKRIVSAHRRGRMVPMLCRNCFLKEKPKVPEKADPDLISSKPSDMKIEEWSCVKCGAALEPFEVAAIKSGDVVKCEYCKSSISNELYS